MLHPAFGVMSREELVFFVGNAQTGEIRELQVLSSLPNLRESDLPLLWHFNVQNRGGVIQKKIAEAPWSNAAQGHALGRKENALFVRLPMPNGLMALSIYGVTPHYGCTRSGFDHNVELLTHLQAHQPQSLKASC